MRLEIIRIFILQIDLRNPILTKNCFFKMLISCQLTVVSENEISADAGKFIR